MTRTIETDTTTSWTLENTDLYDWLEDESWDPILTENNERIYVKLAKSSREQEQDTTTPRTYL